MIQYIGSWLVAVAAVYPVAFRLTETGGKPVDVVLSDALFFLIVLTPPRRMLAIPTGVDLRLLATIRVAATICIGYSLALSLVGYATSAELSRIASAVKFVKPLSFVLLGTYLAMIFPPIQLIRRMGLAFAAIALATMGTGLTNPAFPQCGWGHFLFAWETYGYPNTPMTFYGVMVPLLLAAGDTERRRSVRILLRIAACVAVLLVVASMSRSSIIATTLAVALYLSATGRGHIPIAAIVAGIVLAIAGVGLMKVETDIEAVSFLQRTLERRLERTVDGEDPLSGRGGIWILTLELAADKPLFGYAFESFSRYSRIYDTPHQQYLEIQFKTGLIGSAAYLWVLGSGLFGLWHLIGKTHPRSPARYHLWAVLAMLTGTLIGNLSQPNLSYSLTGNALFLILGLILNRHGAASLVDEAHPQVAASRPVPVRASPLRPKPA